MEAVYCRSSKLRGPLHGLLLVFGSGAEPDEMSPPHLCTTLEFCLPLGTCKTAGTNRLGILCMSRYPARQCVSSHFAELLFLWNPHSLRPFTDPFSYTRSGAWGAYAPIADCQVMDSRLPWRPDVEASNRPSHFRPLWKSTLSCITGVFMRRIPRLRLAQTTAQIRLFSPSLVLPMANQQRTRRRKAERESIKRK